MSLEQEFETRKFLHKCNFVKRMLIKFYEDLQGTGANIPSFLNGSNEDLATRRLVDILDDRELFERKYNEAYALLFCEVE